MNNVLDYDKYRFFQSSYDTDERGTVLSVNHDYWGTKVTYLGYSLLCLGFILTLFNTNSRFLVASPENKGNKGQTKIGRTYQPFWYLGINGMAFSQTNSPAPVAPEHADKFGHLLVQTYNGRFEPAHSLAYDIMHKISRKDKFDIAGKGEMDAIQVLMDMMINRNSGNSRKSFMSGKNQCRILSG